MANNLKVSYVAANAQANALAPLANNGYIKVYDGTQPSTPETAVSTQDLLATLRFNATAFGAASNGTLTANSISQVTIALSGTAAWFRCLESDNSTPLFDGSVGTSGCDMDIAATSLVSGANLAVSSFTYTVPGV